MIYLCKLKPKGIKKRYKIIVFVLAFLLVLLVSPIILLNIGKVQRFVVDKVTEALETKMETKVEIGGVKLRLFNRVTLEDVYLADQQGDTLLFAQEVKANIAILPLFKRELNIREGILENIDIHIVTFKDGSNNIQFILEAFKPKKKSNNPFDFDLNKIELDHGTITYVDLRGDTTVRPELFNAKHIELNDVNLDVKFEKQGKEMSGELSNFSFKERSGFTLNQLTTSFSLSDTLFEIPSIYLRTPNSYIEIKDISMGYDSLKNLGEQLPHIQVHTSWQRSYFYLPDFKYFVPALAHFRQQAFFEVNLDGSINNLKVSNLMASLGNGISFDGDVEVTGLPKLEDAFFFGSINSLDFDKYAIQDVVANFSKKPFVLPKELNGLGECNYTGKITGFLSNLVLYGKLTTDVGVLTTDISLELFDSLSNLRIKGSVGSKQIKLGQLFPKIGVGNVNFKLSTDVVVGKSVPFAIKADLSVPAITFRHYTYTDIDIKGEYSKNKFDGHILLDDDNGRFEFDGSVLLSKQEREFNFEALFSHFNLHQLNLTDKYQIGRAHV